MYLIITHTGVDRLRRSHVLYVRPCCLFHSPTLISKTNLQQTEKIKKIITRMQHVFIISLMESKFNTRYRLLAAGEYRASPRLVQGHSLSGAGKSVCINEKSGYKRVPRNRITNGVSGNEYHSRGSHWVPALWTIKHNATRIDNSDSTV